MCIWVSLPGKYFAGRDLIHDNNLQIFVGDKLLHSIAGIGSIARIESL